VLASRALIAKYLAERQMLGTEVGKDETHMLVLSFVYPHIVKTAHEVIRLLVKVLGAFAKL